MVKKSLQTSCYSDIKLKLIYVPSACTMFSRSDERLRERERENAATFVRVLRNRVARLNTIRSGPEVDQKIQEFATQFCQVGYKKAY